MGIDGGEIDWSVFVEGIFLEGDIATMVCQTFRSLQRGDVSAPLLAVTVLGVLFAGMQETTAFATWRIEEEAYTSGVLMIGIRKDAHSQVLHLSRNKRYTFTPEKLKWDKFKLTYKLLSFPRNLMNASDTRRGIAKAFTMWSDVSPFSFREVPTDQEADIKIGFYPINHTDCLQSYLHHCFDGITGELAHAFFPPTGEIHFDDHEYWILGNMRFSWKKGMYLFLSFCNCCCGLSTKATCRMSSSIIVRCTGLNSINCSRHCSW
ncbi:matrix metalloproteinase-23-like [Salvelinus fontinalis]|uniref:matrix metalloproteinase-23-like n=1 Tax=Salvelinus fontinalis TaxID=8038 RepID=UPI002485EB60|nr:matrix metalloproteinase-23-like [Salvelinus fontinalis]